MPYQIKWYDRDQGIYEITIADPFTDKEANAFFPAFFDFMDDVKSPVYGIFDISQWSDHGLKGLTDPRFRHMGKYRSKIQTVVMVTHNILAITAARAGARVLGHDNWFTFVRTRDQAITYINEHLAAKAVPEA